VARYRRAISRPIALTALVAAASVAVAIGAVAADGGRRQVRIGMVLEQPLVSRAGDPFQYGAYPKPTDKIGHSTPSIEHKDVRSPTTIARL